MKTLAKAVMAAAALAVFVPAAKAEVQDLGEGSLQVVTSATDTPRILTLKRTEVKAEISGFVAEVRVTQVFGNPETEPIEAVYVFPLPENAAVNEMKLTVGDRVIKGDIKKREEARQVYEAARAAGKTAALLDQERPNIFTQSVANIPPGKEIRVTLRYLQDLAYDHGEYRFSFPMTVGPRYIPGAQSEQRTGTGWSNDTGQVPDASRITPPVVKPGERSGRNISLEVKLDAGMAFKDLKSSSHLVTVTSSGTKAEVALDAADSVPNKDFVLTWEPEVKLARAAVLAHKDGRDGYLTLMVQPGEQFPLGLVTSKELLIAIDVSGSMSGFPVETAKRTAIKCLENMNPGDTFQIMSFASGNQLHFERPLANTPENIARGRAVIENLQGGGGTEMLSAMTKALEAGKDPDRMRIVLFMTDGFIGNESQILYVIGQHLNNSRIFPLGVGSSPNRYLLEEMAVMGKGSVQYVNYNEKPEKLQKIVEQFHERIARPLLTDLSADWNGLDVKDVAPGFFPDLFSGQPLYIHARYNKAGKATVRLKGKLHGKPWAQTVEVELPAKESANEAMGPLWARSRITELERLNLRGHNPDNVEKIIMLALEHKLMTQYTSFVAVDETPGKAGKKTVAVESELPEGTKYEGFFGSPAAAAGSGNAALASAGYAAPASRGMFSRLGAYAQAKMSGGSAASMSMGFGSRAGGEALYEPAVTGMSGAGYSGDAANKPQQPDNAAQYAQQLLRFPASPINLRKLVAIQQKSGAFGFAGTPGTDEEQALVLLALVKAKTVQGADAEFALGRLWACLRGGKAAGLTARAYIAKALKNGKYWSAGGVQQALADLGPELDKLK